MRAQGPEAQAEAEGPRGRRPPRPPPPPARPPGAAARLSLPIFGAHTLQGAKRAGPAETCPRAGPGVTDRGRHLGAARRGGGRAAEGIDQCPSPAARRRADTPGLCWLPDRRAPPPPRLLPSPHQTTAPPDPPFSFWRQTAAAAATAAT